MIFLFCSSAIATGIERSENAGVTWTTISGEPGNSIIGSACNVVDDYDDFAMVLVDGNTTNIRFFGSGEQYTIYGTMYNYIWVFDFGNYTWLDRDITHLSAESEAMDISVEERDSTLEGYNGRFAYSSYGFFSAPDNSAANPTPRESPGPSSAITLGWVERPLSCAITRCLNQTE